MLVGYYILPIEVFHAAAKEDPFHACAHQIDDTYVICWARFPDHGHEQRFLTREGVEPLPDARRNQAVGDRHENRLEKYGVKSWHTTLDVSDRLVELVGHCMKLPSY
jgi:hypothetical protein